jgi:hypothetical protein
MVEGCELSEKLWRGCCFAATYCLGSAEAIWKKWSWNDVLMRGSSFHAWLVDNWKGLPLRRERRAVRTPEKLHHCCKSAAEWVSIGPGGWWYYQDFEEAFRDTARIWGMGRYIQLKLIEVFHRFGAHTQQVDLQARGGWSPRRGLASLYPEHAEWLNAGDDAPTVQRVERLGSELKSELASQGLELDYFKLQVFLCEYKQALRGKKYPGRSHDSELDYWNKTQAHWHNDSDLYRARALAFPTEVLGEHQGWNGVRPELETVLLDHDYMWSDLTYDYVATSDFAHPVLR